MKTEATAIATWFTIAAGVDVGSFAIEAGQPIEFSASSSEGTVPTVAMHAYTGGAMKVKGVPHPVVVDLAGVFAGTDPLPLLKRHNHDWPVGHGSIRVDQRGIHVSGAMSGAGPAYLEVLESAGRGFPWQASIGADPLEAELYKQGQSVTVNGRTFQGPVIVSRKTRVNEVSFVPLGADTATAARIAAATKEGLAMTFEEWLKSMKIEASKLSDERRASLEAAYKIEIGELVATAAGDDPKPPSGTTVTPQDGGELIKKMRAEYAAEEKRIASIRELCGSEHADIAAQAIEAGWDKDKTHLEILKAGRATVGSTVRRGTAGEPVNTQVLEAAVMVSLGYDDEKTEKTYGERVMNQIDAEGIRGIGLKDLCLMCARLERQDVPSVFGHGDSVIEAAISTRSLPSVVSNVVGKVAMRVYEAHEIVGLQIARTRPVPDFKQVERYRLNGTGQWDQVGKDGKLKHGILDDDKYTNQADTYGQVLGISRKDIINDDIGILNDIGTLMGQSGASLIDHLLFELLLSNPNSFFHADNANLLTGAGSAFGLAGLANARKAFRKLKAGPGGKAKDQRPIQVMPKILLVPPELETDAEALLNSTGVNLTGSTANEKPDMNPWRNKYRLVVAPHLSDDSYTGYSAAAWYLMADPGMVPALELVFVGGVRSPTIRRFAPPPDTLGIFYQGYFDVGCNVVDPKGAQKSVGS